MEAIQAPISRWMDKENVVCIHKGILLSHKKGWNLNSCGDMYGPRGYYDKWNKSDKDKYCMTSLTCEISETKRMSKPNQTDTELDIENK